MRRGDTLYSIAWQYGVTVNELIAWNHLARPDVIVKGKKIRVKAPAKKTIAKKSRPKPVKPVKASKPKTRTLSARASRPKVSSSSPAVASRKAPLARNQPVVSNNGRISWKWPAKGRVIQRFDAKKVGNKGLNIAGNSGDPVRSAASGKVVYAGSGLSGLGRLIIIKHNNEYLSAYAHNRKLIAREGQWVQQGEIIARLGNSGTDRNELYFEIRKNGRPVDPMRYLPGR